MYSERLLLMQNIEKKKKKEKGKKEDARLKFYK